MSETAHPGGQRLHPSSLLFRIARWGRNLIVPGIAFLLVARGTKWELWLMVLFAPAAVYETVRYFTLRYRLAADELILKGGLIFRSERHIPFGRIQNIDLVQNPFHRLLRVAEVRIETAGGAEPEAVLRVLSLEALEEMRRRVFAGRAAGPPPPSAVAASEPQAPAADAPRTILRLSTVELVKLGLVSNRGLALVGLGLGLAWELDLFERIDWFRRAEPIVEQAPTPILVLAGAVTVLAIPVALLAFSIIWTVVRFHGFALERHGEDLRLSCGFFTRRSATIPRRRIQFVSVRQSLPHRWFGRAGVRVETAGGGGKGGDNRGEEHALSRKWFAPLVPLAGVPALLRELHPAFERLTDAPWQPLAPRALRRMVRKALLIATAVSFATLVYFRPWGPLVLLALGPLAIWYARASARYLSYAPLPGGIAFRSGVWTRRMSGTLLDKVQVASLGESPFDRRYRMASVDVDTAGAGPAGHRIRIPYLDREVAGDLLAHLYRQAHESAFRW